MYVRYRARVDVRTRLDRESIIKIFLAAFINSHCNKIFSVKCFLISDAAKLSFLNQFQFLYSVHRDKKRDLP